MALKKSQLYSSSGSPATNSAAGMDASQYKDYVLTLLFMKYVSDKYAGKPGALIEVPKGGRFADMVKLKGGKEIGDKINKIIGRLAEVNDLKGVIDQADFNDSKLGAGKETPPRAIPRPPTQATATGARDTYTTPSAAPGRGARLEPERRRTARPAPGRRRSGSRPVAQTLTGSFPIGHHLVVRVRDPPG
jgi:hypothetical protein